MNLNKKIGLLLDKGLNPDFISSLNENKINFLFETLSKKKETSEQSTVPQNTIPRTTTTTTYEVKPNSTTLINGVEIDTTGGKTKATPMKEIKDSEELDEKFESKAQQGLFWARCKKCKDKDCKWCKMANEFSKSTSKKQYEKMPEKKHPEKTVKYKKETKESYLDNVGKKVTDTYAKKLASFTPGLAWGGLKEDYNKIIEKYTQPTMKKGDLLKLIESEIKRKKGLNEDFYMEEMDEDFDLDFMSDDDMDMDTPTRPRGKMGRLRMGGIDAPTIEPGIREPKIKPKEPDTTPEWTPDEDEPIIPSPDVNPEPQAKRKKDFLNRFKHDFDRKMSRMDESTYKPINYRKF